MTPAPPTHPTMSQRSTPLALLVIGLPAVLLAAGVAAAFVAASRPDDDGEGSGGSLQQVQPSASVQQGVGVSAVAAAPTPTPTPAPAPAPRASQAPAARPQPPGPPAVQAAPASPVPEPTSPPAPPPPAPPPLAVDAGVPDTAPASAGSQAPGPCFFSKSDVSSAQFSGAPSPLEACKGYCDEPDRCEPGIPLLRCKRACRESFDK